MAEKGNIFKGLMYELKRITWPKKDALVKTSKIVGVFCLIYIFYVGFLDYIISKLIAFILSLK